MSLVYACTEFFDISLYPYWRFERKIAKIFKEESIEVLEETLKDQVIWDKSKSYCIVLSAISLAPLKSALWDKIEYVTTSVLSNTGTNFIELTTAGA